MIEIAVGLAVALGCIAGLVVLYSAFPVPDDLRLLTLALRAEIREIKAGTKRQDSFAGGRG